MIARDLAAYGGPYSDARPQSDPLTQVASDSLNLLMEDAAQMTRMQDRTRTMFVTDGTNDPSVVVYGHTLWGTGNSFKPTVTRAGVGAFTVTFPTSFADGLGEDETLSMVDADAKQELLAAGFTPRKVYARASGNIIYVALYNSADSPVDTTGDRISCWGW